MPLHLNQKTIARQRTLGGANRHPLTQTGDEQFNGIRVLAAAKSILKLNERVAVIEKMAYQGAAITVKLKAEVGENEWAVFLSSLQICVREMGK